MLAVIVATDDAVVVVAFVAVTVAVACAVAVVIAVAACLLLMSRTISRLVAVVDGATAMFRSVAITNRATH